MRRWPAPSIFFYWRTVHYLTPLANWETFSRIHSDGDLRIPSSDHFTVTLFSSLNFCFTDDAPGTSLLIRTIGTQVRGPKNAG
jgi:hypothetical protein